MITLRGIEKEYKVGKSGQVALKGINLAFRDNEFVAILGPSGSGKTTLLNLIGGLDRYTGGDLTINGISTKRFKDRDWDSYRNHSVGFIFQSYNLIQHQSVLANVELSLTISGVSRKERKARAVEALRAVGLSDQIHKKPNQLSGGQMQRVAIARALINDPAILLADEPTGALDSKTSIQVMDLLREVARDRLVIMVTHNPELARDYATRIVELKDGEISSDSAPFAPEEEENTGSPVTPIAATGTTEPGTSADPKATAGLGTTSAGPAESTARTAPRKKTKKHAMGRTSMGFFTALTLSFNNLRTKKGRTILTAFAGSIGIIGIALILSLSTGVNVYTSQVESEMLSEYPIQVRSIAMNLEALTTQTTEERTREEETVYVYQLLERLFSLTEDNDLRSLKKYIDDHPEKLENAVKFIEYTYSIQPQIYKTYENGSFRRVNPDSTMEAAGMTTSFSSLMPSLMSSDVFFSLPADRSLYESQYQLLSGKFPEAYNECVLVLSRSGGISDFALYALGLRDPEELDARVRAFLEGHVEHLETPAETFRYSDFMGITFHLVHNADLYTYDEGFRVWTDRSTDDEYMRGLIENGEKITIVGIAMPEEGDNTGASTGIGYPFSLIEHVIDYAASTEIVKTQLADPDVDVFTGTPFGEKQEPPRFDIASLVEMDPDAAKDAIHVDFPAIAKEFANALNLSGLTVENLSVNLGDYLDLNSIIASVGTIDPPDYESLVEQLREKPAPDYSETLEQALTPVIEGYRAFEDDYRTRVENGEIEGVTQMPPTIRVIRRYLETDNAKSLISEAGKTISAADGRGDIVREFVEDYFKTALGAARDNVTAEVTRQMKSMENALRGKIEQIFRKAIEDAILKVGESMFSMVSIDAETFLSAFHLKMTAKELGQLMTSLTSMKNSTYEGNLKTLGFASLDDPTSINIYPVDFDGKETVISFLDEYNETMERLGQPESKIMFTDTIGTIMETVTLIITIVSAVLMATVGVSLVVSSIMIGIITYISVLERKKEIGILRAIGASKRNVAEVFNAETLITGFLSGLFGIGLTYLILIPGNIILHAATGIDNVNAILRPEHAVILIAISMFLTFIGGLIPARSASKSDPVVALRTE